MPQLPAATKVYAASSALVNTNNRSPRDPALPAPLRVACEAAGVLFESVASLVWGRLYAFAARGKKATTADPRATPAALLVLNALLSFASEGHDRVWPCVETLCERTGLGNTTVDVALLVLRRLGVIRLLAGAELLAGDGPHRAAERGIKRRSKYPVNCYEIGGVLRWLPGWVLDLLKRVLQAPAPSSLPSVAVLDPGFDSEPDPFADPLPPSSVATVNSIATVTPSASVSGVGIGIAGEKRQPGEAPGRGGAAPRAAEGFWGQKTVPRKYEGPRTPAPAPAPPGLYDELRRVGLRGRPVADIPATMGPDWARALLRYGSWVEARGGERRGPGWYVEVWKEWRAGRGSWPDAFAGLVDRERAVSARVAHAAEPPPLAAEDVRARQVVGRPPEQAGAPRRGGGAWAALGVTLRSRGGPAHS